MVASTPSQQLSALGTIAQEKIGPAPTHDHDLSLIDEQLARNIAFLGPEKVKQLQGARIIVVGVGSIGSWTASMLVRSGIQMIRLVDPGYVSLTNLSHMAEATRQDIGVPKVVALKRHLLETAPFARIECQVESMTIETMQTLLEGTPDYVIDTLNDVEAKVTLIQYCKNNGIKVLSAMGAGGKADPTRISVVDISATTVDPLSRALRRRLRSLGIDKDVPVVFSTEKPDMSKHTGPVPDFPTRTLPTLTMITSQFGMAIATFILLQLADFSAYATPLPCVREGLYARLLRDLATRESLQFNSKTCTLSVVDVGYIFEELWQGRSVLSGPQDRIALVRWDTREPLSYTNTVCMSKDEARQHEKLPLGVDMVVQYGQDVADFVNKRFEQEKRLQALFKPKNKE
ncbi:hypothetical protein BDF14DRAFT_1729857 [Spinellus fusiger]|nr:hypothetical protein BDF14DRAFT_1729857 [Spinellus fusiger]